MSIYLTHKNTRRAFYLSFSLTFFVRSVLIFLFRGFFSMLFFSLVHPHGSLDHNSRNLFSRHYSCFTMNHCSFEVNFTFSLLHLHFSQFDVYLNQKRKNRKMGKKMDKDQFEFDEIRQFYCQLSSLFSTFSSISFIPLHSRCILFVL